MPESDKALHLAASMILTLFFKEEMNFSKGAAMGLSLGVGAVKELVVDKRPDPGDMIADGMGIMLGASF